MSRVTPTATRRLITQRPKSGARPAEAPARARQADTFEEVERDLERNYAQAKGDSSLRWDQAKQLLTQRGTAIALGNSRSGSVQL